MHLYPLQRIRDRDSIVYVNRCRRLTPSLLRRVFDDWIVGDAGVSSVRRFSPIFIGTTRERYYRVQYTDLDADLLPRIAARSPIAPSPRPREWDLYGSTSSRDFNDKVRTRTDHNRFLGSLDCNAVMAYMDGSCSCSPGPTGSVAFVRFPDRHDVQLTDALEIGTNITAEMYAILIVLRYMFSVRESLYRCTS